MPFFRNILSHPLTRNLSIDDPRTTMLRRKIIQDKKFLRQIYEEWYDTLITALPTQEGRVLELGAGAGFLHEKLPRIITSEIFPCPNIHLVADAQSLPFSNASLRGIVMTDVLHHLPHPREFFTEAARCVRPGGVLAMIEPWSTPWSRFIYQYFHHEPFDPDALTWELPEGGPLSTANGAIPWIVFHRDQKKFSREFPDWQIRSIHPFMPFRYLLSGGVSLRSLVPAFTFPFWRAIEFPFNRIAGMFACIVLIRR